ncbi:MAG: HlyD family secretion protein [Myxococcales bacterium]|nr:HlyD family secretion protein [Myxococcales bacterium]
MKELLSLAKPPPTKKYWPEGTYLLPAARLVPSPVPTQLIAFRLAMAMLVFLLFAAISPWRQNISGSGRIIAFQPNDRPQAIQAPISGRIVEWHVVEGSRAKTGQVLVDLADNDPDRLQRLEIQRSANQDRLEAYQSQVRAYEERLEALRHSQRAQIAAAEAEVRVAHEGLQAKRELLIAARAKVDTASIQKTRMGGLAAEGLASKRDQELADLHATSAGADLQSARAGVRAAKSNLHTKQAALEKAQASTVVDLRSATAALRTAETLVASTQSALAGTESKLAQQQAQKIRAPRDGIVQRIVVQQGGMQVSLGQTLGYLVPDTQSRAAEIYVDGNDAALIKKDHPVRLQFEGWPALQFSGWPSVASGTFGGKVAFVDPSANGRGDFRVVVVPEQKDDPWPDPRYLRQGTQARGWILLEQVAVGYEIWRQFNGFPPSFRFAPDEKGDDSKKDNSSGPIKIRKSK